jgi:hypothetical protein
MFPDSINQMKFATSIFHSYVHEWECQLKYNPCYNVGWGFSDGEGLERLWSYLSSLVSPLQYTTQNHQLSSLHHRSVFHNVLGIEKLSMYFPFQPFEWRKRIWLFIIVFTLKKKLTHALAYPKHNQDLFHKLTLEPGPKPHVQPETNFTSDFFKSQWQLQLNFGTQKHTDKEINKKLADFFEQGKLLRETASVQMFFVCLTW